LLSFGADDEPSEDSESLPLKKKPIYRTDCKCSLCVLKVDIDIAAVVDNQSLVSVPDFALPKSEKPKGVREDKPRVMHVATLVSGKADGGGQQMEHSKDGDLDITKIREQHAKARTAGR
jgi:hypothetical protein